MMFYCEICEILKDAFFDRKKIAASEAFFKQG